MFVRETQFKSMFFRVVHAGKIPVQHMLMLTPVCAFSRKHNPCPCHHTPFPLSDTGISSHLSLSFLYYRGRPFHLLHRDVGTCAGSFPMIVRYHGLDVECRCDGRSRDEYPNNAQASCHEAPSVKRQTLLHVHPLHEHRLASHRLLRHNVR